MVPNPDRRRGPRNLIAGKTGKGSDRRQFPRFRLPVGYTPILVRTLDRETFDHEGFGYDLSEGGLRFELDRPVAPGTQIAIQILLPGLSESVRGPGRAIFVFANVVWIEDEEEPGPVKMAAVFSRFARREDAIRLREQLNTQRYQRLAA